MYIAESLSNTSKNEYDSKSFLLINHVDKSSLRISSPSDK